MSQEFNIAASLRSVKGVSVSEYTVLSPKVARVIANCVGQMSKSEFSDRLAAVFGSRATAIRASFSWLIPGRSAIGFVAVQTPVREYKPADVTAGKYQRINANLFMDSADESVWAMKQGSGGNYLSRTGDDNLAELIEASRVPPRGSVPRMSSIVSASAAPKEFVSFVDVTSGTMDYGFCLERTEGGMNVMSTTTIAPIQVKADAVVGVYSDVAISAEVHKAIKSNKVQAAIGDKSVMIDYYKKAYGYDKDYLAKVIEQIEALAAA